MLFGYTRSMSRYRGIPLLSFVTVFSSGICLDVLLYVGPMALGSEQWQIQDFVKSRQGRLRVSEAEFCSSWTVV